MSDIEINLNRILRHITYLFLTGIFVFFSFCVEAKEIDFIPLTLYLSDDALTIGNGRLNIFRDINHPDIYSPVTLLEEKGFVSFQYKLENVLNQKDSEDDRISAGSSYRELSGLLPIELPGLKKSALALSLKDFKAAAGFDNIDQSSSFRASQDYRVNTIALSSNPFHFLRAGIGWEGFASRDNLFYEVVLTPARPLSLGYKQYRRDMNIETSLTRQEHFATFRFNPDEDVREISLSATVPDRLRMHMAIEEDNHKSREFYFSLSPSNSLSISYSMLRKSFDFVDEIFINAVPSGHAGGLIIYSSDGAEITVHAGSTSYFLGATTSSFDVDGSGKVTGDTILNFWESLVAGERFFNYSLKFKSTQYHLGMENKMTNRLTLRGGLQYIFAEPEGYLDHWTPFPIIKIGKLDEEILNIEYKWARVGVLTFGFSYRMGKFDLSYGIGQIIPLKIKKEAEVDGAVSQTESTTGGNWDIGNIWEAIKDNPGGNLQIIRIVRYF